MGLREQKLYTVLDAVQATGASKIVQVDDFRHLNYVLATTGMGAGDSVTFQVQGSMAENSPDFGAAQSPTNLWDYIDSVDMENGAHYDGDTGILIENGDEVRQFSVNVDGLRWVAINITSLTDANASASFTVIIKTYND